MNRNSRSAKRATASNPAISSIAARASRAAASGRTGAVGFSRAKITGLEKSLDTTATATTGTARACSGLNVAPTAAATGPDDSNVDGGCAGWFCPSTTIGHMIWRSGVIDFDLRWHL
jgi:hypothetical protein